MKNRKKLILCIVGLPGAGKTTVAKFIGKKFFAGVFETGDMIREEIKRRGLRYTEENDRKIAEWFHSGRERLIVERVAKKIKSCNRNFLVVNGFFAPVEIRLLRKTGKTVLIAITADFRKRYRREILRNRFSNQTTDYLKQRDRRELKEGLGRLVKTADYRIANASGKRDLEKKTAVLVKRILQKENRQQN
jgi:dephospho-CoA kinase